MEIGLSDGNLLGFLAMLIIFQVVMIILDAIIAFYIPAQRVEKRFSENSAKLMNIFWPHLEPKVVEKAKSFEDKLEERLVTLCNNDIPHIIDEKLEPFRREVTESIARIESKLNMEEIENMITDLKRMSGSVMAIQRAKAVSEKKAKRLIALNLLQTENPEMFKMYQLGQTMGMKSESNALLDRVVKMMEVQGHGQENLQKMSHMQAGSNLQTIPAVQGQSFTEEAKLGATVNPTMTEQEYLEQYREMQKLEGTLPPEVLKDGLKELKRKRKEGEKDGKKEKAERKREVTPDLENRSDVERGQ